MLFGTTLTPRRRKFFEMLLVSELIKIFLALYWTLSSEPCKEQPCTYSDPKVDQSRSSLFSDIRHRIFVVSCRRFWTIYRLHLQGSSVPSYLACLNLDEGTDMTSLDVGNQLHDLGCVTSQDRGGSLQPSTSVQFTHPAPSIYHQSSSHIQLPPHTISPVHTSSSLHILFLPKSALILRKYLSLNFPSGLLPSLCALLSFPCVQYSDPISSSLISSP